MCSLLTLAAILEQGMSQFSRRQRQNIRRSIELMLVFQASPFFGEVADTLVEILSNREDQQKTYPYSNTKYEQKNRAG